METVRTFLDNPDVQRFAVAIGIIGSMLGILGFYLAIVFYQRSRQFKELRYAIRSQALIAGAVSTIKDLTVQYQSLPLDNLSIAKVALWSSGTETIRGDDLDTYDPLRIEGIHGAEVLNVSLLGQNATTTEAKFAGTLDTGDGSAWTVDFRFLDKNDGILCQVLHTGRSKIDLRVNGKVIGTKVREVMLHRERSVRESKPMSLNTLYGKAITILAVIVILLTGSISMSAGTQALSGRAPIIGVIMIILSVIVWCMAIWIVKIALDQTLPKGLEAIND